MPPQSIHVMPKAVGAMCNIRCDYCYYLEKAKLYRHTPRQEMSDEVLEAYIQQYIAAQEGQHVLFTWHGGEPLLRPIAFYEKALHLQQQYAQGKTIENALQTNGTLITHEWAEFLKQHSFLVGISIDGTEEMHNKHRHARNGDESGTWKQVMRGIAMLNYHHVEWNAMAVVNRFNSERPLEFYRFFKQIGCHYLQFTPIVERFHRHQDGRLLASPIEGLTTAEITPYSVRPQQWGEFLCTLFDEWVHHDVGEYFIQLFDATLAGWCGIEPGLCTMARTCGHATALEHNGDLYSCDHYVFPEFKLGNILNTPLQQLVKSNKQKDFGQAKADTLTPQCQNCEWLFACHGDCPRTRFVRNPQGIIGQPYLCQGWKRYFHHIAPYMDFMKQQILHNRPASLVMDWAKELRESRTFVVSNFAERQ